VRMDKQAQHSMAMRNGIGVRVIGFVYRTGTGSS
jgi:hypothetical protein